jgi:hypothetical protein
MARPRSVPARPPDTFSISSGVSWRLWLEAIAQQDGTTCVAVIDRALAHYARSRGLPPPPDRCADRIRRAEAAARGEPLWGRSGGPKE